MALAFMALALAVAVLCTSAKDAPQAAWAVTSAEKQAEADDIMRQIDVLQTNLNEATAQLEAATSERDEAIELRDEAQRRIDEQTARLSQLQDRLAACVTSMYKTGGDASFIDVILGAQTFDDFLTSWDAINSISNQGATLVEQTKEARKAEQRARSQHEEQGRRAEEKMQEAQEAQQRIESTKAALEEELEKVTEEVAQLQYQEELAAEAARQAAAAAQAAGSANYESMMAAISELSITEGTLLNNPLPGYPQSSGFGYRDFNGGSYHMGLDLAAPEGTPYYAAESGVVLYATYDGGYNGGAGNWVVIAHGNGMVTKYMHSSAVFVTPGQQVVRGQNIGAVGNTGNSFGAHLHFQLEFNGVAVDPSSFIF